ncbi:MAG: PPC domain-containing DNA-binding protein, partial [Actinomycetota bacterium]
SGIGNVSLKDGQPFVHLHVVATGPDGAPVGGHLMEGTKVYLVEAYFRELGGPAPVREQNDDIGLATWREP